MSDSKEYKVWLSRKDYERLCQYARLFFINEKKPTISMLLHLIASRGFSLDVPADEGRE